MLREVTGSSFSFGEWALLNVPLSLLLLGAGWILLRLWFPIDLTDISAAERAIEERLQRTGRVTLQEATIAVVMIVTVLCWIVLGEEFGLANIALAAVAVLFAFDVVRWRDVEGYVNWGLILMYGGAIALGAALNRTGAAAWLSQSTLAEWAIGPGSVALLVSLAAIIFTEVMSNAAAVAILMPVSIAVAQQLGLDPRAIAPLVAVPAGMGLMLPIGTPANAIAFSSGYLRIQDMVIPGLVMDLIALVIFNLLVRYYWPLLGVML
jgi:sodium-dependent dicarboxylate transporter 2/3/5